MRERVPGIVLAVGLMTGCGTASGPETIGLQPLKQSIAPTETLVSSPQATNSFNTTELSSELQPQMTPTPIESNYYGPAESADPETDAVLKKHVADKITPLLKVYGLELLDEIGKDVNLPGQFVIKSRPGCVSQFSIDFKPGVKSEMTIVASYFGQPRAFENAALLAAPGSTTLAAHPEGRVAIPHTYYLDKGGDIITKNYQHKSNTTSIREKMKADPFDYIKRIGRLTCKNIANSILKRK